MGAAEFFSWGDLGLRHVGPTSAKKDNGIARFWGERGRPRRHLMRTHPCFSDKRRRFSFTAITSRWSCWITLYCLAASSRGCDGPAQTVDFSVDMIFRVVSQLSQTHGSRRGSGLTERARMLKSQLSRKKLSLRQPRKSSVVERFAIRGPFFLYLSHTRGNEVGTSGDLPGDDAGRVVRGVPGAPWGELVRTCEGQPARARRAR